MAPNQPDNVTFQENAIAREAKPRAVALSDEIASPPSAARNDKCDMVELVVGTEADGAPIIADGIELGARWPVFQR